MKKVIHLFIGLAFFASSTLYAFVSFFYYPESGENFTTTLERWKVDNISDTEKVIKRLNPGIRSWQSFLPDERVYIELPSEIDLSLVTKPKDQPAKKIDYSLSAFYTLSLGSFLETLPSGTEIVSEQNSPITLGVLTTFFLNDNYSISASTYLSHLELTDFEIEGASSQSIDIPMEYGFVATINRKLKYRKLALSAGFDYEHFTTYNIDEVFDTNELETRANHLGFLSLGLSKKFLIKNREISSKFSFSQSITSSSSDTGKEFSGTKWMIYLNFGIAKELRAHAFYKIHDLAGPSSLLISRYGVGFGYQFF